MGGKGSGRPPLRPLKAIEPKWGWGYLHEIDLQILQVMAEGGERKEMMHAYGLSRRQIDNRLFRVRQKLGYRNDMAMVCAGIRKGYLK